MQSTAVKIDLERTLRYSSLQHYKMNKDVLKMSSYIFKRGQVWHDDILAELNLGIVELLKFDAKIAAVLNRRLLFSKHVKNWSLVNPQCVWVNEIVKGLVGLEWIPAVVQLHKIHVDVGALQTTTRHYWEGAETRRCLSLWKNFIF